jgi:predicted DNA-binding WGR domain protein
MSKLPVLYNTDAKGKLRYWKISVNGDTITKEYGVVDGKPITTQRSFKGVNIGRSNETTAAEQAKLQANRDWTEQLQKGYKPNTKDVEGCSVYKRVTDQRKKDGGLNINASRTVAGSTSVVMVQTNEARNVDLEIISPMLAPNVQFDENNKSCMKYFDFDNGVYIDPKYDGTRAIARMVGNKVYLTTRKNKIITHFPHIELAVKNMLVSNGLKDVILDGELYAHKIYDENGDEYPVDQRFDIITSACSVARKNTKVPEDVQIQYHIFDIIDLKKVQSERWEMLQEMFSVYGDTEIDTTEYNEPVLQIVDRVEVFTVKDAYERYARYIHEHFEGVIIRAKDAKYQLNKRSLWLRKLKDFEDDEFEVVGAECNAGVSTHNFVWLCKTENGKIFRPKPIGSNEDKIKWYNSYKKRIGQMLTVTFQGKSKDGIPRFPIAKAFRDYE